MIGSWTIGEATVTSIVEYWGPTHQPEATFPGFDRVRFAERQRELPRHNWFSDIDRFAIAIQMWVVRWRDRLILVDSGVGNGKSRPAARMNMLNTLVPAWLSAAGATAETVTHVVTTHLHCDHIGWNTILEEGHWAPTFRNARYVIPRRDFDYFKGLHDSGTALDGSFADSLLPVLEAGLVDFVEAGDLVAGCLEAADAKGHTPGQLCYWLRSGGMTGVFSADILHHPVQILDPMLNTAFCILPEEALATRQGFLEQAAESRALVMPCHFPPPHCGFVRREGDRFAYVPAPPGA